MSRVHYDNKGALVSAKGGPHLDDCFRSNARREVSEAKTRLELRRPVASIFSACAPGMYLNLRSIAERLALRANEGAEHGFDVGDRPRGRRFNDARVARRARKKLRGWA